MSDSMIPSAGLVLINMMIKELRQNEREFQEKMVDLQYHWQVNKLRETLRARGQAQIPGELNEEQKLKHMRIANASAGMFGALHGPEGPFDPDSPAPTTKKELMDFEAAQCDDAANYLHLPPLKTAKPTEHEDIVQDLLQVADHIDIQLGPGFE